MNIKETFKYFGRKLDRFFDNVTKELGENRTILCWIYAAAYLALIFYCVVSNANSHNTAIVTTGGLMGTIFGTYVLSQSYEKVNAMKKGVTDAAGTKDDIEGAD